MRNKKTPKKKAAKKKKKMNDERVFHSRKHPRIPFNMEVEFKTGDSFIKGESENISRGGIFIKSDELLPGGEKTFIKFVLDPELKPVEIESRVAWVQKSGEKYPADVLSGMGVEFIDGDTDKKKIVGNFVRDLFDLWRIMAITEKRKPKKDN